MSHRINAVEYIKTDISFVIIWLMLSGKHFKGTKSKT